MRTPAAFVSGMATMGVLAVGVAWGAGAANETDSGATPEPSTETTTDSSTVTEETPSAEPTPAQEPETTGKASDGTFTGDVIQTRYGPMQVEVVIADGAVVSAVALQQPGDDRESQQINARVIPILNQAVVDYQSAQFGNISRATISTNAYKDSAQSALDAAGFTG